ncbi:transglutaminase TgpA family protein [Salinibaculum rarum]|uniref:transglutaminase TgpA family protein n=1 Tax=Salinibaculum rarum TaxID=3058903 RepID=UPI00266003A8|nr:transglutaminaseTgpA domain-containing protein [Salinibaculum sp. KK48]
MASEDSGRTRAQTRDKTRVLLVVCCLLAVTLAGVLVPTLTGGVVDSPAESLVPGDAIHSQAAENLGNPGSSGLGDVDPSTLNGSGAGGFGALNPGQSTDIGGSTGASEALSSQSTSTHFTVRSSSPAYWRTGAYDRYTGTGWEQTGDTESLSGRIEGGGIRGAQVDYEVELNRSATALPTVWRPVSVSGISDLEMTDQRAVRAGGRVGPGTTFTGRSYKPPQNPDVLRTSGQSYPPEIESRYTALPDDTPSRVGQLTDDITADAGSSYETAVTIEQWLEANKQYSLDASTTSDHMTDTFLFEMDTGYCEYFATAMTTMLRTQDIPARYTVGYSTGEQVGENTYEVRGMNAHAWVEVYFEDVGWVKFDPTPGSERLQQERESLQDQNPEADYSPTEQGSPGEEFSPDAENTTEDNPSDDSDDQNQEQTGETDSGYQVSLNRTAVSGAPITVTVTQNDRPQSGVTVLFNGESIGQTDASGTVVGTVPYADELQITVDDRSRSTLTVPDGLPDGTDDRLYSVTTPRATLSPQVAANLTVPVDTNATISVSGETVPGATVTLTAAVGDVPLREGRVLVDGTEVGTTDANGRAKITLPERAGNVTIAVERGSVRAETAVTLPELSVTVRPTTVLALPYTDAVVNVTADGEPVGNAPVRINGKQVATTDINGTATVTLPLSEQATVSSTGAGLTKDTTVGGLFVNLAVTALAGVLVVGGVLVFAYRRGYTPLDILRFLVALPGLLVQYSQWLLVAVATRWDDAVAALLARLRRTVGHIRNLLDGRTTIEELREALRAWFETKRETVVGRDEPPATGATASEERRTIRRAWRQFLGYLSLRRARTKTPGEIARHAVDRDGLPTQPVRVLRDTFREVEYGARSAEDRLDRVETAVTAIEDDVVSEDPGSDGDSTDEADSTEKTSDDGGSA